jgi:hypothetical protein
MTIALQRYLIEIKQGGFDELREKLLSRIAQKRKEKGLAEAKPLESW